MGSYMSYKSGIDEQNIKHLEAEIERLEKRIEFLEASAKAVATHGRTFP